MSMIEISGLRLLLKEAESRLNNLESIKTSVSGTESESDHFTIVDQTQNNPIEQQLDQPKAELQRQLGLDNDDAYELNRSNQPKQENTAIDVKLIDWEKRYKELSIKNVDLGKTIKLLNENLEEEKKKADALAKTLTKEKKTHAQDVDIWKQRVRDLNVRLEALQRKSDCEASQLSNLRIIYDKTLKNYEAIKHGIGLLAREYGSEIEHSRQANDTLEDIVIAGEDQRSNYKAREGTPSNQTYRCQQVCKICQLTFNDEKALKDHENVHQKAPQLEKIVRPSVTGGVSTSYNGRSTTSKAVYICDFCPRIFKTSVSLKKHKLDHQAHRCNKCGAKFRTNESLSLHMLYHIGPIPCELCGMTFQRSCKLQNHMRKSHSEVCLYACDICGKRFQLEESLKTHKSTHRPDEKSHEAAGNPSSAIIKT